MNLARKIRRCRRQKQKLDQLSGGARKLARGSATEWVRQTGIVQRLDASEGDIVEAVLELLDERLATIVMDEPDADGNFGFEIKPAYERVPWLKHQQ